MLNMKRKRINFRLTSAPWLTRNLTISIEFVLIAMLRGDSLIYNEPYLTMINTKQKRIS